MSRYIDVDALKMKLMEYIGLTNGFERAFSEAPAIELIRCKECKHNPDSEWVHCSYVTHMTNADDFCSYGELYEDIPMEYFESGGI